MIITNTIQITIHCYIIYLALFLPLLFRISLYVKLMRKAILMELRAFSKHDSGFPVCKIDRF